MIEIAFSNAINLYEFVERISTRVSLHSLPVKLPAIAIFFSSETTRNNGRGIALSFSS